MPPYDSWDLFSVGFGSIEPRDRQGEWQVHREVAVLSRHPGALESKVIDHKFHPDENTRGLLDDLLSGQLDLSLLLVMSLRDLGIVSGSNICSDVLRRLFMNDEA